MSRAEIRMLHFVPFETIIWRRHLHILLPSVNIASNVVFCLDLFAVLCCFAVDITATVRYTYNVTKVTYWLMLELSSNAKSGYIKPFTRFYCLSSVSIMCPVDWAWPPADIPHHWWWILAKCLISCWIYTVLALCVDIWLNGSRQQFLCYLSWNERGSVWFMGLLFDIVLCGGSPVLAYQCTLHQWQACFN